MKEQDKIIHSTWFFEGKKEEGVEEGEEKEEKEGWKMRKKRRKRERNGFPKAENCSLSSRIFTRFYTLKCRVRHVHL